MDKCIFYNLGFLLGLFLEGTHGVERYFLIFIYGIAVYLLDCYIEVKKLKEGERDKSE